MYGHLFLRKMQKKNDETDIPNKFKITHFQRKCVSVGKSAVKFRRNIPSDRHFLKKNLPLLSGKEKFKKSGEPTEYSTEFDQSVGVSDGNWIRRTVRRCNFPSPFSVAKSRFFSMCMSQKKHIIHIFTKN